MNSNEDLWRRRFGIFALLRLSGLLLFFLGMGIAFSDLVRPGGHLAIGMVVIAAGLIDALLLPVLLSQRWKRSDGR